MRRNAAIDKALAAWNNQNRTDDRTDEQRRDVAEVDALALGQAGMFSNNQIAAITGLSLKRVCALNPKTDKSGGRFNPQTLPLLLELWVEYEDGGMGRQLGQLVKTIVDSGTSVGTASRLTFIPPTTLSRWLKQHGERRN